MIVLHVYAIEVDIAMFFVSDFDNAGMVLPVQDSNYGVGKSPGLITILMMDKNTKVVDEHLQVDMNII